MRKRGRFEAAPGSVPKKKPMNALLKAYLMSMASLIVSCAMFMGTTAAWFTAEVVNTGNQIQVGVLSVDLLHGVQEDDKTKWISLKTDTSHKVFGDDMVWKPGSTDVQVLKVVNDGQMQLGYQVTLLADLASSTDADGKAMNETTLESLSGHFKVYCCAGENREFAADQWKLLGTLTEVMEGKVLYAGTLAEEAQGVFSIAIALDTDVENTYMGHKMEMYLKLTAYQGGENLIPVSNADSLREALRTGGEILLLDHITFDEPMVVATDAVINCNGKNLTFAHEEQEAQYAFRLSNGAKLTLDAAGSTVSVQNGLVLIQKNTEASLTLEGGTYRTPGTTGEGSGLIHVPDAEGVTLDLVMENMTYDKEQTGWAVRFGDGTKGKLNLKMTGCAMSSGHGIRTAPAGTVEIVDSTIHAVQGLAIQSFTADGVTVTNSTLSAAASGSKLDTDTYGFAVATLDGGTVMINGGAVTAETGLYPLAVLAAGGDVTVADCAVDETAVFIHPDAAGTVVTP